MTQLADQVSLVVNRFHLDAWEMPLDKLKFHADLARRQYEEEAKEYEKMRKGM